MKYYLLNVVLFISFLLLGCNSDCEKRLISPGVHYDDCNCSKEGISFHGKCINENFDNFYYQFESDFCVVDLIISIDYDNKKVNQIQKVINSNIQSELGGPCIEFRENALYGSFFICAMRREDNEYIAKYFFNIPPKNSNKLKMTIRKEFSLDPVDDVIEDVILNKI